MDIHQKCKEMSDSQWALRLMSHSDLERNQSMYTKENET